MSNKQQDKSVLNNRKTNEPVWHKAITYILEYGVPMAVSVLLVVWLLHKVHVSEIVAVIKDGCNYWWIVLMMLITALSHITRGVRWGIQLRAAGVPRMTWLAESVSIFGAYALNLVVPRLGEVWRCVYISRRENVKISTVVGTDLGDRLSDLVVVICLFILAMILDSAPIKRFIEHYAVGREITGFVDNPWLWSVLAIVITALGAVFYFMRRNKYIQRADLSLDRVWKGLKVLVTMRGKWAYTGLTLGIWTCYFLETYVCFFAFPFTREMLIDAPGTAYGLLPGLIVFVFGTFSMAVPSNGGLGPWNLAVMFALSFYGISDAQGAAFSMVMWGSQAAMLVMLGIFSAIYVMSTKHSANK